MSALQNQRRENILTFCEVVALQCQSSPCFYERKFPAKSENGGILTEAYREKSVRFFDNDQPKRWLAEFKDLTNRRANLPIEINP